MHVYTNTVHPYMVMPVLIDIAVMYCTESADKHMAFVYKHGMTINLLNTAAIFWVVYQS